VRLNVPDAATLARMADEARRVPEIAAATARALPEIARMTAEDAARRAGHTALRLTGVAMSSAIGLAASVLARGGEAQHPLFDAPAPTATDEGPPSPRPPARPSQPSQPSPAAMAAGAPGVNTDAADEAAARVDTGSGGAGSDEDLPLANFDQMSPASLRGRLRTLDLGALAKLRTYEKAHANRLQVVTMLENRMAKLNERSQDHTPDA
jgi:hypothetical protein